MASRYWVGASNSLWGNTGNWSATSGGSGGQTVPGSLDDVFFDAASSASANPNCGLDTTGRSAGSITFTGYTSTFTMTNTLTVSGNVTLSSGMTIVGSSRLIIAANATLTAAGKTLTVPLKCTTAGVTINLADSWVLSVSLTMTGTLASPIILKSSSAGVQRVLTLQQGTTQDIDFCNVTDLNGSAGVTAWTYKGTVSNCLNWSVMPTKPGTSFGFG